MSEELGSKECSDIGNNDILNLIIKRKKISSSITNSTLNKMVGALKTILKYSPKITLEFSKLRESKKIIPTIPEVTYIKIFNHYRKYMKENYAFRNYVFLKLLLDTGLRMNEMINLKPRDIDFNTSSIHVKVTKTDSQRYVCFTESTKQLLYKFIVTHTTNDYLFYDFKTNKKLTTSSVESFIHRLKNRLEIDVSITPHKWRHTFATNFIRQGGDLETLRLILGHTNLKTTQKYLHLSKNDIIANYMTVMK